MATTASYKPQFYVVGLGLAEAGAAYPIIRAIAPEISLDDWLDYVRRRGREGGFIGLFDEGGTVVGLASYRICERLRHGRVLTLDDFVTFELSRAAPARAALMAAAEDRARLLGCAGIEVRTGARGLAGTGSRKAGGWLTLGLTLDSVIFVKSL
ncbi:hypothetical protein LVY65_06560 [Sphingomonas sp. G124]|uniref:N-acetyltransferase domain-containing protein n=1 Tax=Sphingomonas cremea TaxID=2904799 RepID=A0A9X1QLI7_9SPHN|nr:hypothetical protein [Sphingomonas cremea]MCF2514724.1 hypothetical protein [Sphingomonas cremea]